MKVTATHVYFWGGEYSQWFKTFFTDGREQFNTAEQYMMYHKAILMGDQSTAEKVLRTFDPKKCKDLGREVKNFSPQLWDEHKFTIVVRGNLLKFAQNDDLLKKIKVEHLGKIFVEASPHDKVWGVGLSADDPAILDESRWKGLNLLGKALNKVQKILLGQEPFI